MIAAQRITSASMGRMRINKRSILLCPSSLLSTTNHHRHFSSINHHSPSLSSFMSSTTMMHQSMNRFMVRFYSSSKSNMQQQQEYEVNDELQDRPISKALFVMNRLAESGDSKQLTLFLEKYVGCITTHAHKNCSFFNACNTINVILTMMMNEICLDS